MKAAFLATTCLICLAAQPASAERNGFGAGLLGGVVGGVIGGALMQPRAPAYTPPPPVYYAPPPVVYERRVYVAPPPPVYVPPAAHVAYHPWPGPGFPCYEPEPNAVNRAICSNEDLSAAALAVQQAYYAAIQQTPYNAVSLRSEYTSFLQRARGSCVAYGYQLTDCISGVLTREHDNIAARLTGVYADEAARPVSVHIDVQQRLRAMGLLSGVADGIYGDGTRRAISGWQARNGRPATAVLTNDEVALLVPGFGAPPPQSSPMSAPMSAPVVQAVMSQPAAPPPAPAPVMVVPATASATAPTPADAVGGMREGMPYGLARTKLANAGWQTQYFSTAALSDQDREARQWFIDHRIMEVEDCSSSGCKLQFHNNDGRLLYVYTQIGSRASDAYRGAGPSVIAYCMDVDDITCSPATAAPTQQAIK